MKKVIAGLIALCLSISCVLGLSACGCNHENGTEKILKEPTCTAPGEEEFICSDCGETIVSEIPMISHDYSIEVSNTATCSSGGIVTYKCSMCDAEITENSPAVGHDYIGHFCKYCEQMESGFNKIEFNSDMFDLNNLYSHSLGSFILLLGADQGSSGVEVTIFFTGKRSCNVLWSVTVLNNTKKSQEAFIYGSGKIQYNKLTSFSGDSTMKNNYDSSNEYYVQVKISQL